MTHPLSVAKAQFNFINRNRIIEFDKQTFRNYFNIAIVIDGRKIHYEWNPRLLFFFPL